MPNTYTPRPAACSHCGDVVLVVEQSAKKMFGFQMGQAPTMRLEHADPGPNGEVFDGVDGECRRPRVA